MRFSSLQKNKKSFTSESSNPQNLLSLQGTTGPRSSADQHSFSLNTHPPGIHEGHSLQYTLLYFASHGITLEGPMSAEFMVSPSKYSEVVTGKRGNPSARREMECTFCPHMMAFTREMHSVFCPRLSEPTHKKRLKMQAWSWNQDSLQWGFCFSWDN